MKRILAIAVAKIIKKISQITGRGGSNLPGKIARKIDRKILVKIREDVDTVIFITGTNGKTTTSQLVGHILKTQGKMIHNKEGSNLIYGITTAFIDSQKIFQKEKIKYAVIEIDEGSIKKTLKEITPDYLIVTNLFEDQVERYGSPSDLSNLLKNEFSKIDVNMILNANDPYVVNIGMGKENNVYYAISEKRMKNNDITNVNVTCPNCSSKLEYSSIYHDQIGTFTCEKNCGIDTKISNYLLEDIVERNPLELLIDDTLYQTNLRGDYNAANILAAISLCKEIGIPEQTILNQLANLPQTPGRMENFTFEDKKIVLTLSKNAAGVNATLKELSELNNKQFYFFLDNKPQDGITSDWIENIKFEQMKQNDVTKIVCSGLLSKVLYKTLEKEGLKEKAVLITDKDDALNEALSSNGDKVFISNYSPLYGIRNKLKSEQTKTMRVRGTN